MSLSKPETIEEAVSLWVPPCDCPVKDAMLTWRKERLVDFINKYYKLKPEEEIE